MNISNMHISPLGGSISNFNLNVVHQIEPRIEKLERLKQEIEEGTYQIEVKELANIMIVKMVI